MRHNVKHGALYRVTGKKGAVRGDRGFVARALGKVALRRITPAGAMSFAGLGVPARVAALLSPPMKPLRSSTHGALWGAITVTGMLAAFQIHHLARLITALCPG